jgi:ergothioneine biosynthesis protein EgtB
MATPVTEMAADSLSARYRVVREQTLALLAELQTEDTVVQSMPDVSPTKWHLAHVTWFFERFVLEQKQANYQRFDDSFDHLFNSYYNTAGTMHARPQRGLLSRPTLAEILKYRQHVDAAMQQLLLGGNDEDLVQLTTLGLNHEQQHQELLLTDIKHVFSCNPLLPAVSTAVHAKPDILVAPYSYLPGETGLHAVGAEDSAFFFDNETPRHDTLLQEHRIGQRLITNGEFREFIQDGGYESSTLWLSDGWSIVNERRWSRPLYWGEWLAHEFTLGGQQDIDDNAPVCHISYYEADAYARWAGARLPSEFEWEAAATRHSVAGNFLESKLWHPAAANTQQFFGDVWEWTSSSYAPYPGFKPLAGTLGEYNGKFMCNQMTVRGGSCVTPGDHMRASYRSFFYPDARWQFLGFRLAKDGHGH